MKEQFIGYQYFKRESNTRSIGDNSEYYHPTFLFKLFEKQKKANGEYYYYSSDLFEIVFQQTKGENSYYSGIINNVQANSWHLQESLRKLFNKLLKFNNFNIKHILKLGATRMELNRETVKYYPYRYRKNPALWFEATKKGYDLRKVA